MTVLGEALAIAVIGLLLGQAGPESYRKARVCFAVFMVLGIATGTFAQGWIEPDLLLLPLVLIIGAFAALALALPARASCIVAASCGLALGIVAAPLSWSVPSMAFVSAGKFLGANLVLLCIAGLVARAHASSGAPWLRIGTRVLASWAIAITALSLAFRLSS